MDKTLSKYAEDSGKTYMQAWREFKNGDLSNAYKDNNGNIYVKDIQTQHTIVQTLDNATVNIDNNFYSISKEVSPLDVISEKKTAKAATRLNRSALTEPFNRFNNIDQGYLPTLYKQNGGSSTISAQDTITLCQKAYFNFSIVRNVIDIMTEFCTSKIYLNGGNETSRNFFEAYFRNINIYDLQDRFFREYWRSGNVFLYPLNIKIDQSDVRNWINEFKLNESLAAKSVQIPAKYVILNPADINIMQSSSFVNPVYYKTLNGYEIESLKNPKNEIDQAIYDNLPGEVKNLLKSGSTSINISLNSKGIYAIFYKKQDYEAFAVPMVFPVLDDLQWKSELKRIDQAISRTVQQAILLITVGYENKGGHYCVNKEMITTLQSIFQNESVGRVLINDFTTKAEFIIPQIGDILNPQKYKVVNDDIRAGLNDILSGGDGGEKFANQSIKVKIFIGRLMRAREVFFNSFLIPEMKKISKMLGFKACPVPKFETIDLEDSVEWVRAVTRLGEIGVLTPDEVITSMDTGRLPTSEESVINQEKFKLLKDKGYYQPITVGAYDQKELAKLNAEVKQAQINELPGRKPGKNKTTKKITPISRAGEEFIFSSSKVKDTILLANELETDVKSQLKQIFNIKKLNDKQNSIAKKIAELIMINEDISFWKDKEKIKSYCSNPLDTNPDRVKNLNKIAADHGLDNYTASILLNSIVED